MAEIYKTLSEISISPFTPISNDGWNLLYTVPENTYAIIKSMIFCNIVQNLAANIEIAVLDFDISTLGGLMPAYAYLLRNYEISPYESRDFGSIPLQFGKYVYVRSIAGYVSIHAFGSENT